MFTESTVFTFLALALGATAKTIRVDVGQSGLTFTPDTITASMGDILEYHFHPINHSVVMGDFSNPCQPAKTGGFFSGFMPVSSGEASDVFRVTVNSTDPIFFYCAQNVLSHCKTGMAGVVNPSGSQTLAAYQSAAKAVSQAANPEKPFGGDLSTSAAASPTPSPAGGSSGGGGGGGAYGGGGYGGGGGGSSGSKGNGSGQIAPAIGTAIVLASGVIAAAFMS